MLNVATTNYDSLPGTKCADFNNTLHGALENILDALLRDIVIYRLYAAVKSHFLACLVVPGDRKNWQSAT